MHSENVCSIEPAKNNERNGYHNRRELSDQSSHLLFKSRFVLFNEDVGAESFQLH